MRIVLDRFEGDLAVLEVGDAFVQVPRASLPGEAREGSVLRFVLDPEATAAALEDAEARLARLQSSTPQGPGSFDL
jgi:hypothetical protein